MEAYKHSSKRDVEILSKCNRQTIRQKFLINHAIKELDKGTFYEFFN